MKVRQRLARRLDGPRAQRRLAAARRFRRRQPGWEVTVYPLGDAIGMRVRARPLDVPALRAEIEAQAQAAQDARTLHVAPTDYCDADAHLSGLLREGAL